MTDLVQDQPCPSSCARGAETGKKRGLREIAAELDRLASTHRVFAVDYERDVEGGDGHVATAAVRLVESKPTGEVGFEYFSASPSLTEATSLPMTEQPTLVGSTTLESSEMKGSFSPWYVDAVESTGGFFESRSLKLRPGKQLVGVYYFVCKPYFAACRQGTVMLRVTLAAGGSYRVAGEFKNNTASAWIEDAKTGSRLQQ